MKLLEKTIAAIEPQDAALRTQAEARLKALAIPPWALGRIMDLARDLAGMTRSMRPPVSAKTVVVMAGDHGVVDEGVSCFPREVTPQMVAGFVKGIASINAFARDAGAHLAVVDMGVAADLSALAREGKIIDRKIGFGTANMTLGPAMALDQARAAVEAGIEVAMLYGPSTHVFGTGDMGIGNTTPSAAIGAVFTGRSVAEMTGRGTGVNDAQLRHKIDVIERAIALNEPDAKDPLDVLSKVGGFEIGGIAGLILGAARQRKPVLVDGFISTAGALVAKALCPASAEYMVAAHRSMESGHRLMLEFLGKEPLIDLNLRLGEGTGAALSMHLVDAAYRTLTEIATFAEAAVSEANA